MVFKTLIRQLFDIWIYGVAVFLVVGSVFILIQYLYQQIQKLLKQKTKKELLAENGVLQADNQRLSQKIEELQEEMMKKEVQLLQQLSVKEQFINIGSLKVKSKNIMYIASQSYEQNDASDSRIKIIHYNNCEQKDYVYSTFEVILEKLAEDFMMINKNVLVNLKEISRIQGNDVYLKNVKSPFLLSDYKKEEFDFRISKL